MILAIPQARMSAARPQGKAPKRAAGRPMAPRRSGHVAMAARHEPADDIRAFLGARPDLAQFGGHRRI